MVEYKVYIKAFPETVYVEAEDESEAEEKAIEQFNEESNISFCQVEAEVEAVE